MNRLNRLLHNQSGIATLTALMIVGLVFATVIVGAVVYSSIKVQGKGKIAKVNLEIYADPLGQTIISAIDWGTLDPGGSSSVTLYFKSLSNVNANLSFTTSNWIPQGAQQYFTLRWNYDGTPLIPDEIRGITLTLSVVPTITGVTDFSFDMTFTATSLR